MDVSELTRKRIEELLKDGKRMDERKPLELRPLSIELGVSKKAEGSARVKFGDTEVIAGAKLNVIEPFTDTPDNGALMVVAEFWPLASEKFEMGPPDIQAIELARIIDRSIRESEFIDLKKLCIKKGELVWAVFLDIYPINDAGNLIDASAIAVMAALQSAVFPSIKGDKVQYGEFTTKKVPLKDMPVVLTFYRIGKEFILDPTTSEEEASNSRLTIAMTFGKEPYIHALQKAGDEPLSEEEILKVLSTALKEGKKIFEKIKSQLK
ncbi:MAG: exosome complex protein Rrp42 [Candidatus Pacearchaeota archaeon]|nr:MAG: exosome complex protein Rrp42 [Candidatus Pacearchaeota archaeon]